MLTVVFLVAVGGEHHFIALLRVEHLLGLLRGHLARLPLLFLLFLLIAAGVLLFLGCTLWGYGMARSAWGGTLNREWLQRLVSQVAFAQGPLVPSHWMASGLVAAARRDLSGALYHLALVWANGLFLYVVTAWIASRLYRRGYNRVATGGLMRRRYGGIPGSCRWPRTRWCWPTPSHPPRRR